MPVPEFDDGKHFEAFQHPKQITLILPLSLSINRAYMPNPNGKGIIGTPALDKYKKRIDQLLRFNLERLNDPDNPYCFHSSFLLEAEMSFCMSASSDTDNRVKPLWDALEYADVFKNDKCIHRVKHIEACLPGRGVPYHVWINLNISHQTKRTVVDKWWE